MSKHVRRPTNPSAGNRPKPTVLDCMYHRCERHQLVRMLNSEEQTGAECGACIAEDMLATKAQLLLALDGYADRLAYGALLRDKLAAARNALNLLSPGAGDFLNAADEPPKE